LLAHGWGLCINLTSIVDFKNMKKLLVYLLSVAVIAIAGFIKFEVLGQ